MSGEKAVIGEVGEALVREAVKAGVVDKIVAWLVGLFKKQAKKDALPGPHKDREREPFDEDIPDPVGAKSALARIQLGILRVVLSAKRFPKEDAAGTLSYIPEPGANIPYQSKVTFEGLLFDGTGAGISVPAGSPYAWTRAFYLKGPSGQVAQIGPGVEPKLVETDDIGSGGKNYVDSKGMIATFRCAVEGQYEAWSKDSGVESNHISFRVD